MASVINTYISSLTAQRNLMMSQTSLSTSMQRLPSGLRINSAKDAAAGLAISDSTHARLKAATQEQIQTWADRIVDGRSLAEIFHDH